MSATSDARTHREVTIAGVATPPGVEQAMRTYETVEQTYLAAVRATVQTGQTSVYASSTAPRR